MMPSSYDEDNSHLVFFLCSLPLTLTTCTRAAAAATAAVYNEHLFDTSRLVTLNGNADTSV